MKNKPLIITLIIFLSLIVLGLISIFVGLINNKFNFKTINWSYKVSNELIYDQTFQEDLTNIKITADMSEIEIKYSDNESIKAQVYGEKEELKTDTNNHELNINYQGKSCIGFCFNKETSRIIIYLPKNYNQTLEIDNDYGDIKIKSFDQANIKIKADCGDVLVDGANKLDVNNDYGDIKVGKVNTLKVEEDCGDVIIDTVKKADIKNSYGDIEIKNVTEYIKIEEDCGDIEINNLNIIKDSSINNNYGDIEIEKTNDIYIDSKVDLGDNEIHSNNRQSNITLKITNDCGDVNVN